LAGARTGPGLLDEPREGQTHPKVENTQHSRRCAPNSDRSRGRAGTSGGGRQRGNDSLGLIVGSDTGRPTVRRARSLSSESCSPISKTGTPGSTATRLRTRCAADQTWPSSVESRALRATPGSWEQQMGYGPLVRSEIWSHPAVGRHPDFADASAGRHNRLSRTTQPRA